MLFALAEEIPTCALGRNSFSKNCSNELHQGFFKQLGIKLPIDSLCWRTPFLLSLCVFGAADSVLLVPFCRVGKCQQSVKKVQEPVLIFCEHCWPVFVLLLQFSSSMSSDFSALVFELQNINCEYCSEPGQLGALSSHSTCSLL